MDNEYNDTQKEINSEVNLELTSLETVIPVVQESFTLDKETIETAKVHISKKVAAHQEEINIPLTTEQYEFIHVPINQTVSTPPPAVRQEGDTTIFSVIKEVLVVEKKYEIIEEVHITKRTTNHIEQQTITLLTEEVNVTRAPLLNDTKGV